MRAGKAPLKRPRSRRGHGRLKHYFVPGAHNAFRPHFLRAKTVLALGAIIILLFLIAIAAERLVVRSPSPQAAAVVAAVLVDLANTDRFANDLGSLATSSVLERAAQMKADDMAARGYFSHNTPEGLLPWHWFEEAGYRFRFAGENLAVYFSDSAEVERAWMNSPSHRANLLSEHFTEIGIALSQGQYQGHDTVYVVQMFAAPSESASRGTASTQGEGGARVAGAAAEARFETIVEDDTFIAVKRIGEAKVAASVQNTERPVGAITNTPNSSAFWKVVTSPKTLLQYVYIVIGSIIALALILVVVVEFRRQSPLQILYGFGLLALIVLLFRGTAYFSGQLLIL